MVAQLASPPKVYAVPEVSEKRPTDMVPQSKEADALDSTSSVGLLKAISIVCVSMTVKLVAVTPLEVNVIVYQTALSQGSAIVTVNECVSPPKVYTIPGLSAI